MLVKKLLTVGLATIILAAASNAFAQSDEGNTQTNENKPKTLSQRLDKFGKSVFGGIFSNEKSKQNANPKPSTLATPQIEDRPVVRRQPPPDMDDQEPITSRSAVPPTGRTSGLDNRPVSRSARTPVVDDRPPLDVEGLTPENAPVIVRRPVRETPKPLAYQPETTVRDQPETMIRRQPETIVRKQPEATVRKPAAVKTETATSDSAPPLHQRLSGFRQSVFPDDPSDTPARAAAPAESAPDAAPARTTTAPERTTTTPIPERPKKRSSTPPDSIYPVDSRPLLAERVPPPARPAQPISEAAGKPAGVGSVVVESRPSAPENLRPTSRTNTDEVLIARKGPILSVDTTGPRTIAVGRESTYQVNLRNSGEVAADDLVLHVTLPEWTEVVGLNVTVGDAPMPEKTQGGAIVWRVGHVDAKSQQRLTIRLVPRQNRPFDMGVRWEFKPIATQAMIEVQEPRLSLKIEGPREVQYGRKELYRLKLTNTGNGTAENVVLVLTPIGAGDNVPASHKVGILAAGEEKSLDVELTARQSGTLTIQAEARGDNGAKADLEEKVLVHRAALKLDVEGPRVQFVGSVANYNVRIRNTGTAVARNVHFTILLPNGAKYISGVDGIHRSPTQNKLEWILESLSADVEQNFTLRCALGAPGLGKARVYVVADDDLMTSAETIVQIDSVANLVMEVKDPTGPVPVGEDAIYELRIRNRGTREAENVEVFGYFSRGIEPVSADGAPNRLAPGQVTFQPLPTLAPGTEAVLRIRARAEAAGNHVFRAEARCKTLNARLVSEATNLYYTDGPMDAPGSQTANPPPEQTQPPQDAMRLVPRPTGNQPPVSPQK
jgi:uncharacterized repeat protein (TIGR01451 family)